MPVYLASASASILLSIGSLNSQLNQTEQQLSTGNAVNSAADNPYLWSQATGDQSTAGVWGAIATEINTSNSTTLATATSSLTSITSTLNSMLSTLTTLEAAQTANSGSSTTTALSTLASDGASLTNAVNEAYSSNGANLLKTAAGATFVNGYDGSVETIGLTTHDLSSSTGYLLDSEATGQTTASNLTALASADISSAAQTQITIDNLDDAIANITNYASSVGAVSTAETAAYNFASAMKTNYLTGADDLIAADLSTVSTRETALQTQLQLADSALSIANQTSQYVLKLFL